MSKLKAKTIIDGDEVFREFKGALGEQLALQEMLTGGLGTPHYYQNDSTRTEIDFVIDSIEGVGGVVPVEVKYGTNLRAKSLSAYVKKHNPELAVRVSASEHSWDGSIEDVPFYALAPFLRKGSEVHIAELPAITGIRESEKVGSSNPMSAAILSLLEGSPLSRRELVALLESRRGIEIEPNKLSSILAKLKQAGVIKTMGSGINSVWEIVALRESDYYRLMEGDILETDLKSTSRMGLLQMMSDNDKLIGSGQRVLDVFGGDPVFTALVDTDTSLEELNDILSKAFPDYGYRIVKRAIDL